MDSKPSRTVRTERNCRSLRERRERDSRDESRTRAEIAEASRQAVRRAVRSVREYLRGAEDLRADDFTGADGLAGYCYVATEVLYHRLGKPWRPYCVTVHASHHSRDVPVRVHHYYLMDEESGECESSEAEDSLNDSSRSANREVLDPTVEQFETAPDYGRGRPVPVRDEPSPRAQTVLDALDW